MDDLSWLGDLFVWIGIATLCGIHWCLYSNVKRLLASWIEDPEDPEGARIFMMCPLPWWLHIGVFHFSFLITAVLIWLITILLS